MRVIRVKYLDKTFYAQLVDSEAVLCLNKALGLDAPIPLSQVTLLPVVWPTKIVCVGVNYREHAQEMDKAVPAEPLLFLKPPSAIIGNGQAIVLPGQSGQVDHEAELALVMGQVCRNITPEEAPGCIFGYTCANDVTARDLQRRDVQFTRAKGFDTFAPLGPWIETDVPDPAALSVRCLVNDEVRQNGHTSTMIVKPFELVSFISKVMTLLPGDVVLTGTPSGVGPLRHGDEVRVEIEGVGLLINSVEAESAGSDGVPLQ